MSDVGTVVVVADGATLQRRRGVLLAGDRFPLLAALAAADDGPLAAEAAAAIEVPAVTDDEIAEALEHVWTDHCADTGCIPSNFKIHGPGTTQVSAQFRGTDFAFRVAEWINFRRVGRPRESRRGRTRTVYVASKARHVDGWKQRRSEGAPIISTWLDDVGRDVAQSDVWQRAVDEASSADVLIAYYEAGEEWKGAFVEIGAALAGGVPVIVVGNPPGGWMEHPLITPAGSLDEAFVLAAGAPAFLRGRG